MRAPEPARKDGPCINEEIRVREVHLIDRDGTNKGTVSIQDALAAAQDAGLDLVEISPNAAPPIVKILENKYYMVWINENILAASARALGRGLWKGGDMAIIDGIVNGSASTVGAFSRVVRTVQTGYLSWYALVMVLGVFGLMTWQLWPYLMGLIAH